MKMPRFAKFGALTIALSLTASTVAAQTGNVAVESAERDRFIVVFNDDVQNPRAAAASLARQHGFAVRLSYSRVLKGFAASLPARALQALGRDRRVAYIEADQLASINAQTTPTGVMRIFADGNANISIDGTDDVRVNADVAVIDTGVFDHPDLNVAGRTDCTGSPRNKRCKDGSGNDGHGHGTHVAGTIGALDNGIGVVGVAPGVRIWSVKVLKDNGSGWISNIIGGIDWVATQNIKVANMSLGGGNSDALCAAVVASVGDGVTYAVAAGNSNTDAAGSSPANCAPWMDGILTVSALADFDGDSGHQGISTCRADQDDTLADFSNYGTIVDIAAPGVCIRSTWNDSGYNTISGTSMAAPHVAGAAALLAASGMNTPAEIHQALIAESNDGWTDESGDGVRERLLDVSNAGVFAPATETGGGDGGDPNTPPVATILEPTGDANPDSGTSISFAGTAADEQEGDLTADLVWNSNPDGPIGTGGSFSTTLSDGTHTITASATDLDSATGSDSVTITVGSAPVGGGLMHVGGIAMNKKGRNLDTIVTIVGETGTPVADAVPTVSLCIKGANVCWFQNAQVATDGQGTVKYKLLKPSSGTYVMTVHDVSHASYEFAGDGTDSAEITIR
jgi:subtilisin family serine protease